MGLLLTAHGVAIARGRRVASLRHSTHSKLDDEPMRAVSPFQTVATAAAAITIFSSSSAVLPLPELPSSVSCNMPFQQYNTANDIPKACVQKHKMIYGQVEKVIDGDTIRVRHYPFYPLKLRASYTGNLSENTISVRIYGVDAPEVAKFGNPSMFQAQEAKQYVESSFGNRVVRIKMLRKDQYNRLIAKVTRKGFFPFTKTDLSVSLASNGFATLYTGGGAEYDGKRDLLEKRIEKAKRRKQGIWQNGSQIETPAEYKRNVKKNNNNNVVKKKKTSKNSAKDVSSSAGYAVQAN